MDDTIRFQIKLPVIFTSQFDYAVHFILTQVWANIATVTQIYFVRMLKMFSSVNFSSILVSSSSQSRCGNRLREVT